MKEKNVDYYEDQAEKILKQAEKDGVLNNFLFVTSFERYIDKTKRLQEIKKELATSGYTVDKTYNGSTNEVATAAYRNYIAMCDSLDKTASLLEKITRQFRNGSDGEADPILGILNGGGISD
jgi:hypothetical protein